MEGDDRDRAGRRAGVGRRRPLTGATAAKVVDASQASWLVMRAPPEKPVAYTSEVSMQYRASRAPTSWVRKETSSAAPLGTARPPTRGTPGTFQSKPLPSGIRPCG